MQKLDFFPWSLHQFHRISPFFTLYTISPPNSFIDLLSYFNGPLKLRILCDIQALHILKKKKESVSKLDKFWCMYFSDALVDFLMNKVKASYCIILHNCWWYFCIGILFALNQIYVRVDAFCGIIYWLVSEIILMLFYFIHSFLLLYVFLDQSKNVQIAQLRTFLSGVWF